MQGDGGESAPRPLKWNPGKPENPRLPAASSRVACLSAKNVSDFMIARRVLCYDA